MKQAEDDLDEAQFRGSQKDEQLKGVREALQLQTKSIDELKQQLEEA